jgi:hypothetical protein
MRKSPATPEIQILQREHELLRQDLETHRDHAARITAAAERLGKAIQLLAKPPSNA